MRRTENEFSYETKDECAGTFDVKEIEDCSEDYVDINFDVAAGIVVVETPNLRELAQ